MQKTHFIDADSGNRNDSLNYPFQKYVAEPADSAIKATKIAKVSSFSPTSRNLHFCPLSYELRSLCWIDPFTKLRRQLPRKGAFSVLTTLS
jgi:hypothetical protein